MSVATLYVATLAASAMNSPTRKTSSKYVNVLRAEETWVDVEYRQRSARMARDNLLLALSEKSMRRKKNDAKAIVSA